jgi:hypothetical protein
VLISPRLLLLYLQAAASYGGGFTTALQEAVSNTPEGDCKH